MNVDYCVFLCKCPNLQMVIVPSKGKIFDRVVIDGAPICYKQLKKVSTKE